MSLDTRPSPKCQQRLVDEPEMQRLNLDFLVKPPALIDSAKYSHANIGDGRYPPSRRRVRTSPATLSSNLNSAHAYPAGNWQNVDRRPPDHRAHAPRPARRR